MTVLTLVSALVSALVSGCASDQQVEMIGCAMAPAQCNYTLLARGRKISDCHHLNI